MLTCLLLPDRACTFSKDKAWQVLLLQVTHDYIHALLPVIPGHDQVAELINRAIEVDTAVTGPRQSGG